MHVMFGAFALAASPANIRVTPLMLTVKSENEDGLENGPENIFSRQQK